MKIIQVEITNACSHGCANCTRFCGHHARPFFMDRDTFQRAVDSLEAFPGMVGMMGGEPTLHPEFETLTAYLARKRGQPAPSRKGLAPIADFSRYLIENDCMNIKQRLGLWSSLGQGYYRHFELIQEVFDYQLINDHGHPGLHQTLLVTREELGIPDESWIELRDNCWAQNLWSASVTPKGCFFCEVAAAMDMLFDGPGGWPIEPGWWRRGVEDFSDQLHWCEMCSATLNVPRVPAQSGRDLVSPRMLEKLEQRGSPRARAGKVEVLPVEQYQWPRGASDYSSEWYLPGGDNTRRVTSTNATLKPQQIDALIVHGDNTPAHLNALLANACHFDNVVVVTRPSHAADIDAIRADNMRLYIAEDSRGREALNGAYQLLSPADWVALMDADVKVCSDLRRMLRAWIFNPGCLYSIGERYIETPPAQHADGAELVGFVPGARDPNGFPWAALLFNIRARALRERPASAPFLQDVDVFRALWEPEKRIKLRDLRRNQAADSALLDLLSKGEKQQTLLMTQHILTLWRNLTLMAQATAWFGAGQHSKWLLTLVKAAGLPLPRVLIDDQPQARVVAGIPVHRPGEINMDGIDLVMVSSDTYADEMAQRCRELWGNQVVIVHPYSDFSRPHFQK